MPPLTLTFTLPWVATPHHPHHLERRESWKPISNGWLKTVCKSLTLCYEQTPKESGCNFEVRRTSNWSPAHRYRLRSVTQSRRGPKSEVRGEGEIDSTKAEAESDRVELRGSRVVMDSNTSSREFLYKRRRLYTTGSGTAYIRRGEWEQGSEAQIQIHETRSSEM